MFEACAEPRLNADDVGSPTLSAACPHLEVLGEPADAVLAQHGGCVAAHQRAAPRLEDVSLVQLVRVRLPLDAALQRITHCQSLQPSLVLVSQETQTTCVP